MTEEENRAIEYLKNRYWYVDDYDTEIAVETILKLLEKQQKEIEELKEENAEQLEVITEWVNGERINDIKHISKDKIRKEIRQLEALDKQYYKKVIVILEKMLGE